MEVQGVNRIITDTQRPLVKAHITKIVQVVGPEKTIEHMANRAYDAHFRLSREIIGVTCSPTVADWGLDSRAGYPPIYKDVGVHTNIAWRLMASTLSRLNWLREFQSRTLPFCMAQLLHKSSYP